MALAKKMVAVVVVAVDKNYYHSYFDCYLSCFAADKRFGMAAVAVDMKFDYCLVDCYWADLTMETAGGDESLND
jgi:hypothetical protein